MGRKKTHEEFVAEVKTLVGGEYIVLGEYKNNHTKIEMLHIVCNSTYLVSPNSFLRGSRCSKCFGNPRKSNATFKAEVYDLVGNDYVVLGEYKNIEIKIEMLHKSCNEKYLVRPQNFLRGIRCPKCAGVKKKSTSTFKQEVLESVGDEYIVLGEYKNNRTKIEILHNVCKGTYSVLPKDFLRGIRCPKCMQSKGEVGVESWLKDITLKYTHQYRLSKCKDKNPLPFDFAVFSDDKLLCLIEYDGIQHYEPREYFGGESALRQTQRRDAIKTKYCADNNIPLIRIPYWEYDNIDAILTEKLLPLLYNADKQNAS